MLGVTPKRRPRRRAGRAAGALDALLASKEMVLVLRLGRRRQDDDRRGARAAPRPSSRAAGCSCSPSTRPAAWPTRSASARSATWRRGCRPTAFDAVGVAPRGELWAAMLDTKAGWDELIRRHAPDAEIRDVGARQPAVPEHHQPLRAQPRLPGDGAAPRAPRVGRLRPRRRRHAAVAQRPRRARRAVADGRVLRQPAAPVAHRAVPLAPVHGGVEAVLPGRRPRARLAASCRTSPSSSSSSRRWRRGSSPAPARSRRCSATRARRSSSSRRWRRRRRTRPRTSPASWPSGSTTSARSIANRVLPRGADVARRGDERQAARRRGRRARPGRHGRRGCRAAEARRRDRRRRRRRRRAHRGRRPASTTSPSSPPARPSGGPSWPPWRRR